MDKGIRAVPSKLPMKMSDLPIGRRGTPHALTGIVRRPRLASSLLSLGVTVLVACSAQPGEDEASSSEAVAVSGRWRLPAAVAAAGAPS